MYDCEENLDVRRNLLNPNFEGYKLSLDALPKYHCKIPTGVDVVQLREDQYSVHHVRIFGLTNHLVLDKWNPDAVYFIDRHWNVRELKVTVDSQMDSPRTVFTIPDAATKQSKERLNTSMGFPSHDLCVLSDGTGELYVLSTVSRGASDAPKWKILWRGKATEPAVSCIISHVSLRKEDVFSKQEAGSLTIDCLLLHIEKDEPQASAENSENENTETAFATILEWLTLMRCAADAPFTISHHRRIKGKAAPLLSAVEETGRAVYVAGEGHYEMVYDSLKPVEKEKEKKDIEKDSEEVKEDPAYTWTQTMEDVTMTFTVPQRTQKSDINLVFTPNKLCVELKNGPKLLEGPLFRDIDVSVSTWILEGRKLEVGLAKKEDEMLMWPEVVVGDNTGQYLADPDQARIIHERLAHLTSDELNPEPTGKSDGASSSSNCQMLEECDAYPENVTSMIRLDGETHQVTNSVNIGTNQWLFNAQLEPDRVPAICLRHDVDGLLWQPGVLPGSGNAWLHTATFNALGYVQASKRDKKFASCPPDTSYAALCDCVRHVYIYRQPEGTMSLVKNRKTGKSVTEISKQQLVSLDCQDDILGMQTTNERIYILTSQRLYAVRINNLNTSTT